MSKQKNYQIDMSEGNILKKLTIYVIPLVVTNVLQLLYNAVDIIIVGRYVGTTALSAVGSTTALVNLLVNLFIGLSIGATVVVSRYFGAKDDDGLHKSIHTAILISIISGFILAIFGTMLARNMLKLMNTPSDVLELSTIYITIFFLGMPFNLLYNFGAAILRAVGDTKRPLYFLTAAGIINVVLNIIFVTQIELGVAGVALATIISQAISACLVTRCLIKQTGALKLEFKKLRIHKEQLIEMVKIGLPAGIQSSFFSISNVLIQSSINTFGSNAMAGNAASLNLEGFIYISMNCVHQAAITFTSQNIGAKQFKRVRQSIFYTHILLFIIATIMCGSMYIFRVQLVHLYNTDPMVTDIAVRRITFFAATYVLCGIMDVIVGHLRGLGHSIFPMITTLCGVCGIRIFWVYVVFRKYNSLMSLYISYPVSWIIATTVLLTYYIIVIRKTPSENFKKID